MTKVLQISICFLGLMSLFIGSSYADDEQKDVVMPKVQYHELKPSFVANFGDTTSKRLKFVKADVSVVVSSGEAILEVKAHNSLIRHQIVMALSEQSEDALASPEGQEALRLSLLKKIQEVLKEETSKEQIDDLLFTSFVVQR